MRITMATAAVVALSSQLAAQNAPPTHGSTVTVGAAVAVVPRYPGSDEHRVRPFPTVEWTLGSRRITAGPRPGGDGGTVSALVVGTPRIGLAAELGYLDDRPESRADALGRRLWASWVVVGATRRFYHAGDTGYSPEFAAIGRRLGPIDAAVVPIGAYRPSEMMHFVHTTPEEGLRIGLDVRARRIVAMHFGTFDLADEPLDEPPQRFRAEAERLGLGADRAWVMSIGETRAW